MVRRTRSHPCERTGPGGRARPSTRDGSAPQDWRGRNVGAV